MEAALDILLMQEVVVLQLVASIPHPGSGTDVASPDDGWRKYWRWQCWYLTIPHLVEVVVLDKVDGTRNSDYPPGSAGGDGGIGASYTIKGTAKKILVVVLRRFL